jgi:hypothetical protein
LLDARNLQQLFDDFSDEDLNVKEERLLAKLEEVKKAKQAVKSDKITRAREVRAILEEKAGGKNIKNVKRLMRIIEKEQHEPSLPSQQSPMPAPQKAASVPAVKQTESQSSKIYGYAELLKSQKATDLNANTDNEAGKEDSGFDY